MSDNEGMPDTPYREMSFLDEIIDYHRPHKPKPGGGSQTVTWRIDVDGPFGPAARFDAVFADIGFWTYATNVHDPLLGRWLSAPILPQLDPIPTGPGGIINVDLGTAFSGEGSFRITATAHMGNASRFTPIEVGIAIVKFTDERFLLPLSNLGDVTGSVGEVIASSVGTLNFGQSDDFGCEATGNAYLIRQDPFPPRLGGSFALGVVGGVGTGTFSITHTVLPPPPPP